MRNRELSGGVALSVALFVRLQLEGDQLLQSRRPGGSETRPYKRWRRQDVGCVLFVILELEVDDLLEGGWVAAYGLAAVDEDCWGAGDAELDAEGLVVVHDLFCCGICEAGVEGVLVEACGYG